MPTRARALGFGAGFVGFLVLLEQLAIGGGWRDVTELQWATAVLGIPHPPGSPVYLELAHVATLLPFGSIAWRVNLVSAIAGAGALAVTYLLSWRLSVVAAPRLASGARSLVALAGPVVLIGSPVFRLYSTTAEVYALQTLGVGVLACWLLQWEATRPRDLRPGLVAIFACAVAAGVHVSFVFYLPAVVVLLLCSGRHARTPRAVAIVATAVVLGAAVFSYVPLRAAQSSSMNWGNPVTLERTYFHLLNKKDARPRREVSKDAGLHLAPAHTLLAATMAGSTGVWGRRLHEYTVGEVGLVVELAGLLGLVGLAVGRRSAAAAALLGIVVLHAIFGVAVGKWASPTGYTPIYLLLAGAAVAPAAFAVDRISRRPGVAMLAAVTVLAVVGRPVLPRLFDPGARVDRGADELARELFEDVRPRGILLAAHYWPIVGFAREIEGYRTDVDVIFRNQIYGSQRMVIDEARHPAVRFPSPLPRNPNREERLWRMSEFLALNHGAGRSIAWQSDMDDLYFRDLVPDGLFLAYRPGATEATERGRQRIEAWVRSFEPDGARRSWLVGEFGVEEALLPAARHASWQASRLHCDEAQAWYERLVAMVPPGHSFRPALNLSHAVQGCRDALERSQSASSSPSAASALGE